MTEVRIGESNVVVPTFTGFKIARAGRLIAAITEAYPGIVSDVAAFTREYESQNAARVTPDMAKMPRFKRWNLKPADFGDKGFLEIPTSPTTREQVIAAFPKVFKVAERDVTQLLALVVLSNQELAETDEEGGDEGVDALIEKRARKLLHEAQFEQLIAVAIVAANVLQEQFNAQKDEAGELFSLLTGKQTGSDEARKNENDENAPNSSSASDAPTDGQGAKSSTASRGSNSSS